MPSISQGMESVCQMLSSAPEGARASLRGLLAAERRLWNSHGGTGIAERSTCRMPPWMPATAGANLVRQFSFAGLLHLRCRSLRPMINRSSRLPYASYSASTASAPSSSTNRSTFSFFAFGVAIFCRFIVLLASAHRCSSAFRYPLMAVKVFIQRSPFHLGENKFPDVPL